MATAAAGGGAGAPAVAGGQGIMTREQLLHLFARFSFLTSLPEVKERISGAVSDNQEAVAVTTELQEEILREMGIDPNFGIGCLGKVNLVYANDMELMIKFYQFVAKEEMAIDEAELEPREFAEKINVQQELQRQQLEMLVEMRKYTPETQSIILETLREQLENGNFETSAAMTAAQMQEIAQK